MRPATSAPARRAFRTAARGVCAAVFVAVALFSASHAFAQQPPRPARPYRGLFGGAQTDAARSQTLDLNISFLGGYDDNVMAGGAGGGGGISDPRYAQSGGTAAAYASLVYRKARRENWVEASARSGFRYFPSFTQMNAADYGADARFSTKASARTRLGGYADASYFPFYSLFAIPVFAGGGDRPPMIRVDYGLVDRASLNYGAGADASYDLARHTRANAGYSFRGFDFTGSSDTGRMRQHSVRAGLSSDVGRRVTFGGGYVYDYAQGSYYEPSVETRSHGADLSVDYRRTLRSRRQVAVGFSGGYSRLERLSGSAGQRVDHYATAGARLLADIGRTWTAGASYRRGFRYLPGLSQPIFSDDVQAKVGGLAGRRVDLQFWGQYSNGVGSFSSASGYSSAGANAQVRCAINRMAAATFNYLYYHYQFPEGAVLPVGLDRQFGRHAVRVGVDLWLPLYR